MQVLPVTRSDYLAKSQRINRLNFASKILIGFGCVLAVVALILITLNQTVDPSMAMFIVTDPNNPNSLPRLGVLYNLPKDPNAIYAVTVPDPDGKLPTTDDVLVITFLGNGSQTKLKVTGVIEIRGPQVTSGINPHLVFLDYVNQGSRNIRAAELAPGTPVLGGLGQYCVYKLSQNQINMINKRILEVDSQFMKMNIAGDEYFAGAPVITRKGRIVFLMGLLPARNGGMDDNQSAVFTSELIRQLSFASPR